MVRPVSPGTRSWGHAAAVMVGATLYGAITVGGRIFAQLGFSLFEIAITGGLFGALLLAPVLLWRRELRVKRRDADIFIAFGLMGAVLQIGQFLGIVLGVPVAIVALLLYTQPLWTVLLGRLWLGEPITRRKLGALALAAVGIVVLVGPTGSAHEHSLLGLGGALLAGVMLAVWIILGRTSALRGNHPLTTTFAYQCSTTLGLLALWPVLATWPVFAGMARLDAGVFVTHWQAVLIYTVLVNVAPALLVMWGIVALEASTAGMLLLLEPAAAAFLAWLMFGEAINGQVWLGGALILGSNAVLLLRRPRRAIPAAEPARTSRSEG